MANLRFTIPTGEEIEIREQNGNDEDLISKISSNQDNTAICEFVSAIMVEPKMSPDDVFNWPLANKYYTLLKSRIHSLGPDLKFKYSFKNKKGELEETNYVEDLSKYDIDLAKVKSGEIEIPPGDVYKVRPYPFGNQAKFDLTLKSGKEIKVELLTTVGEREALETREEETSANLQFKLRNLQWKNEQGAFIKVENYSIFTSRDMVEIRAFVNSIESNFEMPIEIENPFDKLKSITIPIIAIRDFFFPTEV